MDDDWNYRDNESAEEGARDLKSLAITWLLLAAARHFWFEYSNEFKKRG